PARCARARAQSARAAERNGAADRRWRGHLGPRSSRPRCRDTGCLAETCRWSLAISRNSGEAQRGERTAGCALREPLLVLLVNHVERSTLAAEAKVID